MVPVATILSTGKSQHSTKDVYEEILSKKSKKVTETKKKNK